MVRNIKSLLILAAAIFFIGSSATWAQESAAPPAVSVDQELMDAGFTELASATTATCCIPDGSVDDTLGMWSCCSGFAVTGSTVCTIPSHFGTSWTSCRHVCGTAPVNGCVPSGGWEDTLSLTSCCSGQAVSGSTWCLDPADYGTDWKSCIQKCQ